MRIKQPEEHAATNWEEVPRIHMKDMRLGEKLQSNPQYGLCIRRYIADYWLDAQHRRAVGEYLPRLIREYEAMDEDSRMSFDWPSRTRGFVTSSQEASLFKTPNEEGESGNLGSKYRYPDEEVVPMCSEDPLTWTVEQLFDECYEVGTFSDADVQTRVEIATALAVARGEIEEGQKLHRGRLEGTLDPALSALIKSLEAAGKIAAALSSRQMKKTGAKYKWIRRKPSEEEEARMRAVEAAKERVEEWNRATISRPSSSRAMSSTEAAAAAAFSAQASARGRRGSVVRAPEAEGSSTPPPSRGTPRSSKRSAVSSPEKDEM